MCTVTYIKNGNAIIITSNRDEAVDRIALAPQTYIVNGKKLIFPKDTRANGTWFAVSEDGYTAVLLNGAEEKHVYTGNYRRSRGLILLDILSSPDPITETTAIDLENIEPFTLVLSRDKMLYQFRWDGKEKKAETLDAFGKYIWASSTLYSEEIRIKRKVLFNAFIGNNNNPTPEQMMNFHQFAESSDTENGFIINRNGFLRTVSITQCVAEDNKRALIYNDLIAKNIAKQTLLIL